MCISSVGVTLGVAVLIIVLSVMTGFDREWRERLLGFHALIEVVNPAGSLAEWDSICEAVAQLEGVRSATPLIVDWSYFRPVIRCIPRCSMVWMHRRSPLSRIQKHLIQGSFSLRENEALIGSGVAQRLGLQAGDTFTVIAPQGVMAADEIRLPEEWRVAGIFHLGMYEIDQGFIYAGLPLAQALFESDGHISQWWLENPMRAFSVAEELRGRLPPISMCRAGCRPINKFSWRWR